MSELDPHRYEHIDTASDRSWYMTGPRAFEVYQSVGTIKPDVRKFGEHAVRQTLAGNMSPMYGPEDEAIANIRQFYTSIGLAPGHLNGTVLLKPQRKYDIPLQMRNADEDSRAYMNDAKPATAAERADFLYSYAPETILAVRPADCPIVYGTAETPEGQILMLSHFAWQGAASGFVDQMFDRYDDLGVDRDSLKLYVTPGGQAESFPYTSDTDPREKYPQTDNLFTGVTRTEDGFSYAIDTPNFVYQKLLQNGLRPEQIYADTSDTSRLDSGYSSHGRAARSNGEERNIRDIIIAVR